MMKKIDLDATLWKTIDDFYAALLPALGAPEGHGTNINAIIDSMIGGDMNAIEPPYTIVFHHSNDLPRPVVDHIDLAAYHLAKTRAEFLESEGEDIEVVIERA